MNAAIASYPRMLRLWKPGILVLALLFSLPIFTTFSFILHPSNEVWQHLVDTVLGEYLTNSILLMSGVGIGTLVIGVGCGVDYYVLCAIARGGALCAVRPGVECVTVGVVVGVPGGVGGCSLAV